LPGGEPLGDAVLPGAGGPHLLGDVAHGRDLETVRQLAEIVEVHDLSDQAASDDPYAQSAGHIHPGRNTRAEARWNVPTTLYERVDGVNRSLSRGCQPVGRFGDAVPGDAVPGGRRPRSGPGAGTRLRGRGTHD